MPRYVDLDKLPLVNIDVDTVNRTAYVDIREVQQALRQAEAQTGEVAPVVHGNWMSWDEMFPGQITRKKNNLGVFCSECNSHNDTRSNYCPECGAKMVLDKYDKALNEYRRTFLDVENCRRK